MPSGGAPPGTFHLLADRPICGRRFGWRGGSSAPFLSWTIRPVTASTAAVRTDLLPLVEEPQRVQREHQRQARAHCGHHELRVTNTTRGRIAAALACALLLPPICPWVLAVTVNAVPATAARCY